MLQSPISNRENQMTKLSGSASTGTGLSHYTNKIASLGIPLHSLGCSEQSQWDKYSHRETTRQLVNVTLFWRIACSSAHGDSPAVPGKLQYLLIQSYFSFVVTAYTQTPKEEWHQPKKKKFNPIFSNRASHLLFKMQKLQGGNRFTDSLLNTPALVSLTLTEIHLPKPLIQGFIYATCHDPDIHFIQVLIL